MDEFGSPISGGIRAVRRNISSSFLSAPQNSQPDSVTTGLLQEQSLKLTTVSGQLQNISRQVATLDFNIKSVRENIALGDQLERQREAAKQNRERILAEQGLREGKESALENKIQSALMQPIQRIGVKTQGILGKLTNLLFTLAGGWLTITGVDLLQAMAEGNVDKINRLKTKFLVGLTTILGSLVAIKIGIKKVLGVLGIFSGNVARIAFGGILKAAFTGLKVLLVGLVKKAALLTAGVLTAGGIGGFLSRIVTDVIANYFGFKLLKKSGRFIKKTISPNLGRTIDPSKFQNRFPRRINKILNPNAPKSTQLELPLNKPVKKFGNDVGAQLRRSFPKGFNYKFNTPSFLERARSGAVGLFNRGKNLVDDGLKAVSKSGVVSKAMNLTKGLPKLGVGKLLGKALGPFITFFTELLSEDGGLMSALAATAGFMAGAKVGAIAGGAIGALFGGVGAGPGAFIGALIGGFAGESVMKNLAKKIMNALGMKDVKIFGDKDKKDNEVEGVSADSNNIEAVKNNNLDAANNISQFSEDDTEIIVSQGASGDGGSSPQVSGSVTKTENAIPSIDFDKNNPHALSTTAVLGVAD